MPMLIEHIDAIARQKKRDVLYVEFHPPVSDKPNDEACIDFFDFDWKARPVRQHVIDWLNTQGIGWQCCGSFADVDQMGGYRGQIYVDVPFDNELPAFQSLQTFLELPDGSMRYPEADLCCCPLELAKKNTAHDEPGFWERWAETF